MISIIPIIIALTAGASIIYLAVLTFKRILRWLQGRREIKEADKNNIAFSLQEKLKNGKYQTIYGIFNKDSNHVLDSEKVHSNEIDAKLKGYHQNTDLLVFE
jgi:predicted transcriptional regulator